MRIILTCLLLFSGCIIARGQSLAELERQLDSLLNKQQKSEVVVAVAYGNNPAYGSKTTNVELPIVMKTFLSPSVTWYHKSGFYAGAAGYYLFNTEKNPWFECDLTAGYDYTKNRKFLTGISYTRYFFADSTDIPETPIKNELFAYFLYRQWWLQPSISLDYGWGHDVNEGYRREQHLRGNDFNIIAAVRHPFIFNTVFGKADGLLLTPSIAFTMGTANYFSQLKAFQYISRSPKMRKEKIRRTRELYFEDHTGFEPRAVDITLNAAYLLGRFTFSPAFTVFKPLAGEDLSVMSYFTARLAYNF
ncbi:hypothetical protein [Chitinophaga solisilvae]|uniref:Uncharacterized protein n=1 Tax=Chitinophaga solisilvae TaxID=1233460 RepID=A0A433WBV2_9BACT|nr:hypothetical protein [Chitinophaga solisilvae]NSL88034.1 hypothetical protein [Chitinophaga solisilvae]